MGLKQRISLREYGLSGPVPLTDAQLMALNGYTSFIEVKAGGSAGLYCLQAGSWVGDLLLPGLVISVVPKIGPTNLLTLLLAGDGEATPEEILSFTQNRADSFWDFLGNALISETARLVSYGLERNYVEEEGNLQFPVGQIQFGRDFVENTPVRKGIQCRHTVLTEDIHKNQIVKWGLETLSQLAGDSVALRLSAASKWLEMTESPVVCPEFTLPQRADRYFMPLYLVDMLLRFACIGAGAYGRRGQGYLVDMNRVFEGYVRQQLRHRLQKSGVLVVRKGEEDRNLCDGVKLEPDLVLVDGSNRVPLAIADCKYKRNWDRQNDDVYQMLAYLEGYRPVDTAIVLYPTSDSEITKREVSFPRDRRLVSIGIPEVSLLDGATWDSVTLLMREASETAAKK